MITDRFGNIVPEWYAGYVELFKGSSFLEVLERNLSHTASLIVHLTDEKLGFAYADGKWTIAEVLLHIIDCERIFSYRALRMARNDATPLPGFDENAYALNSDASSRTKDSLLEEYLAVRRSTLSLYHNFSPQMLSQTGVANGHTFSVDMIGTVTAGHELHHLKVLKERYGL